MKEQLFELGINADDAIRRFMGKKELYLKSMKKFVSEIAANGVKDLNEVKAMEIESLRSYVHGLKGVTANLSMLKINALLIEIESTVKAGKPDFVKYEEFSVAFRQLAQKVLDIIIEEEGPIAPDLEGASGSEEECRELLMKLNKHLMLGQAKECETIITKIREKKWNQFDKDKLLEICNAVDGYDYARAMEMIDDVR